MSVARTLATILTDPARAAALSPSRWSDLLSLARAERLSATLAERVAGQPMPRPVAATLTAEANRAHHAQRQMLWEADEVARVLAPLGLMPILLKGSAYAAAGLAAAVGRNIGDTDILLPRDMLPQAEAALLAGGWEWVKTDPYDHAYYRRWMHELPPLIHASRDRMLDVHHTILPLTARPKVDAGALIAGAVPCGARLKRLGDADLVLHAAAHCLADGELDGAMRNLWDVDRLLRELSDRAGFWAELRARAALHQLWPAMARAGRLARALYATPLPADWPAARASDALFLRRILARDGWGRGTARPLRAAFYVRGHLLRMPLRLLVPHLARKAFARTSP